MQSAGGQVRTRHYVLGLVILVHLLVAILFLSSNDKGHAGGRRFRAGGLAAGGTADAPPMASSEPSPRRRFFLLSYDRVGLVGASSLPPPRRRDAAEVAPLPQHP